MKSEKELLDDLYEALRYLRQHKLFSLTEMEHLTGVAAESISRIERGKHNPTAKTLIKIAKALGCRIVVTRL